MARHHLVGHHPQREQVGGGGDLSPRHLFRGHVRGRAEEVALGGHGRRFEVRDPEVHELGSPVREHEHVPRLDVAMDDPRAVRVVERVRERGQDAHRLVHGDLAPVAQDDLQRGSLQVLHDEVVLAHVEDAHDARVGEAPGRLGLAAEPAQVLLAGLAGEELLLDRLHRDHALHHRIEAAIHAAHRALADLALDLVAPEPLRRHLSLAAARWR